MKLGYVILYTANVDALVAHYEAAFGLKQAFRHESGLYTEMDTGETILAFAAHDLARGNDLALRANDPKSMPGAFEIVLVAEDVAAAYAHAVEHGAQAVRPPEVKPWGQTVAYVRDMDGGLVELASPIERT